MHWLQIARMYENQFIQLFAWVTGLGLATLLLIGSRLFWKPAVWAIQRRVRLIFLGLWSAQLGVCWATSVTLLKWRYFVPQTDDTGPEFHHRMYRAVLEMTLLSVWLLMVMAFIVRSSPGPASSLDGRRES